MSDQQTPPNQPSPFDYQKWIHELKRQDAQRAHDNLEEFHKYVNKATMKSGEMAIRMALLINGGAAVALLSFIGTLPKEQKHQVAGTLVWFAWGVAAAVGALAFSYFTNYFMAGIASSYERHFEPPIARPGRTTRRYRVLNVVCHVLAVIVGLTSLGLFVGGMLDVKSSLLSLK